MNLPMELLQHFQDRLDRDLPLLRRLVELESHSLAKEGVDRIAGWLAAEFEARGAVVETIPFRESGNALLARYQSGNSAKPVMFLGHLDTVWPVGTIADRPFRIQEGRAYGPGIFDMKAGVFLCLLVCHALHQRRVIPDRDVVFFFSPDEETGSVGCLESLERTARTARAVLCLEPPLPGGKAKTSRKGCGTFHLQVSGVEAHAGLEPEKGASAILEISRLILRLQHMNRWDRGQTVQVGTVHGGSAVNVIPGSARAEVDFRFTSLAEGRRLERRIRGLRCHDPRCAVKIEGGISRPPLERTPAVARLYEQAKGMANRLGMDLGEGDSGGGSDGSFTAALGIPTLDGMGAEGDGAHAGHEHVVISDLPRRAALLTMLAQGIAM
jgi:glutamate carboxypeptidase